MLLAGWLIVDWAMKRPQADYETVGVPLRLIAEKRLLAADEIEASGWAAPWWIQWQMNVSEIEAIVLRLFDDAHRNGLLDDALNVERSLALHRAAIRDDNTALLEEARALLRSPSDRMKQVSYFESARKVVSGLPLNPADVETIRQHLAAWPGDWWLNYLAQHAGITHDGSHTERSRRALGDLVLSAAIETALLVLGLIATVPFLRSLRWPRSPARRERRLWRLWGAADTVTLFAAGSWLSIAWTLGANWFLAEGFQASSMSEEARWLVWLVNLTLPLVIPVWFLRRSLAGAWGSVGRVFDIRLRAFLSPSNLASGLWGGLSALWILGLLEWGLWLAGVPFDESLGLSRTFAGYGDASLPLLVFYGVILAPFIEEALFRGFLFNGLKNKWGAPMAAAASSAIFAALHHYDALGNLAVFLYGLIFCHIFHRTNRLSISITVHATNNLVLSILSWLQYR